MDSRSVQPGDLFVTWRGGQSHGLEFLPQVLHAGVAAVAYEPSPVLSLPADAARVFPIIVVAPSVINGVGRLYLLYANILFHRRFSANRKRSINIAT